MIRLLSAAFLCAAFLSAAQSDPTVSNGALELTVSAATGEFHATDKRIRRAWRQEKWRDTQAPSAVKASGRRVEMNFPGFTAIAELDAGSPEFVVTVSGQDR